MKDNWIRKALSVFLVVFLMMAVLPVQNAFAAVTRPTDWTSVGSSVGNGTTLSTTGTYAAAAGTERYTLLAVTVVNTGATVTSTVSGTWGGVAFNSNTPTRFIGQVGNGTSRRVIYLFGFNETDIVARANDTITISSSLNSATTYMHSYMSTYAGVNQTTPTTVGSVDNSGGNTTTAQYTAALNTVNGSYGASILLVGGTTGGGVTNTDAAATPNTSYAMNVNNVQVGAASGTYATLGNKAFTGTATTRPTFTFSNNRNVLIGVVLAPSLPNTTTAGTATATAASSSSINVSMPYTDDGNTNNTYTVDYKLSSAVGWTNWVTNAAHTASPYTTTITGLSSATSYDVRVTYNDADGVTGTPTQTISNVTTLTNIFDTSVRFTGNGNPLTQSYTIGSGGDLLVVSIVAGGTTSRAGGAPTYNGIALTQANSTRTANETVTEMWYLVNPSNGAAYNISIPNNGGLNLYATASSYFAQSGYTYALDVTNGNTNGNSPNPSVSVTTTANGDVIVGAMGNGFNTAPTGRSGTMLYENDNGFFSDNSQYFYQATAGAYATNWTIAADDWGVVVAAFKPVEISTTVGTATATAASSTTINVSMPYTVDNNANNTYTVDYKLSSAVGWTNWVTNAAHIASPYTTTITGLSGATSYDVRVTYNDADGVTGTSPQTINNILTSAADTSVRFTGAGNPLTQSYTIGSGGDLLVISIVAGGNTARTGGAPTYNGAALTQADSTRIANETVTEMWYLVNPSNGTAYNISIPNNGGLNLYATASSYFAQSGYTYALDVANGNTNGNSANPSVSVTTTANGDVIVGAMGNGNNTAPTGRSGTMLYENDNGLFSDNSQYFYQTTAGAYATSWTIGADDWGVVVAAFKQTILPNSTTVGSATAAAASSTSINVSMPYTDDGNLNNTYTVEYKLSSALGWTNWVTNAAHIASPYTTTITGLLPSSDYDVRVTYNDADGVTGTNPQTISNITTPATPIAGSWTNVFSGTGTTVVNAVSATSTSTCTAGAGSNRVVLIAFSASAAAGPNSNFSMTVPTATFGGVSVTEITSTKATADLRPHAWIGYIKEANIPGGAQNISISFTKGGTNNSAIANIKIFCATYTNVDQTSVFSHAVAGPNTALQAASPTISMNAGVNDQAILFTANSANTTVASYAPVSYSSVLFNSAPVAGYNTDIAHRTIPASVVTGENTTVTWNANGRSSILGVTLKRAPNKLDQTITVGTAAPLNAVFNSTFTVGATSDSGLNVDITTSGGCSGSGTTSALITMTSGTTACVVHYNQAGDATYNAATEVTSSTTAQKANPTITFNAAPTPTYQGGNFVVSATTTNTDSATLTYSYVSGPCAFVSGGTFSSTGAGTCVVQANGAATANFNAASNTQNVSIAKATATVTLGSLAQTYDGTPKSATAVTNPLGLTVDFTYDGSPTAPTNANSYAVVGTINDPNYTGTANGTLVISKATATVTLGSLAQIYDGTPKSATAVTNPLGLTVDFTYDGSPTAPTNANSYAVVGTINDPNYTGTANGTLVISKATATVTLGSLAQTYDGTPKSATAVTNPLGLTVDFTYDGSPTAPTNANSYAVVGTINDPNYTGTANGTLVISKATATVTLGSLAQTYDGTPKSATAVTNPLGLTVDFTYDGSPTAPTNANSYAVVGTINDPNYAGSANGTLVISKATATVTLGSLAQTYDGTPKSATAVTVPGGLTVDFTYDGSPTAPTNANSYAVVGTINDPNYAGSANGTLVISKATATVTLGSLAQTYDGTPKSATAVTVPGGLTVDFTYDGSPTAPTNANSYAVVGTVNDPNYTGTANGTLVISKATATVTLGSLAQTYDGTPKSATAVTVPGGLTVDFTYDGSPTAPTNANSYAVVGTINDPNYAGSANGTLVIAKANQNISFTTSVPVGALVGGPVYSPFASSTSSLIVTLTIDPSSAAVCVISSGDVSFIGTGTCVVNANQAGDSNYNPASQVQQSFGVGLGNQAITMTSSAPASAVVDGPVYTPSATGGASGNPVVFTIDASAASVCSIAGGDVSFHAIGTCVVNANQAGNSNYAAAAQVQQSFAVGKGTPVILWSNPADITYGTPLSAVQLNATASVSGTFTYNPVLNSVLGAGAGQMLSVDFTPTDTVNYLSVNGTTVTINVLKADPILTVTNSPVEYNGSPRVAVVASSVPGTISNILYDGSLNVPRNIGTYAITADFVPTDSANYNSLIAGSAGDFVITPDTPDYPTFVDVPMNHWAWAYIESIYAAGITGGCGTSPLIYCPSDPVTRAQMAIFILRGVHGKAYVPPPASGTVFTDIPTDYWAADWIEQLAEEGITVGCGDGNYCPENAITRAEMSVFLLRSKLGSTHTPPPATGTTFADVPANHWAASWIEQLALMEITSGCGDGNFCPEGQVTRDQMAVFIQRMFNFPLP